MGKNSQLVYSTATGRIRPEKTQPKTPVLFSDGLVRIRRETKGRKGKGVVTITGLPLTGEALKTLAKELKRKCGTGGSVKNGIIEIQGDAREVIMSELEKRGYKVKLAGG
ncbi:MAG: stress response translation initiation inhibitor YciH [Pseudomonadota bacterium]